MMKEGTISTLEMIEMIEMIPLIKKTLCLKSIFYKSKRVPIKKDSIHGIAQSYQKK